jgi:hypothetical protein
MKVNQLIKALQKMPQNLEVGYAHGDNREYEVAGWCIGVMLFDKSEYSEDDIYLEDDKEAFRGMRKRCVIIRG